MKVNQFATIQFNCGCRFYLTPNLHEVPASCPECWKADKPFKVDRAGEYLDQNLEVDVVTGKAT